MTVSSYMPCPMVVAAGLALMAGSAQGLEFAPDCFVLLPNDDVMSIYATAENEDFVSYYLDGVLAGRSQIVLEHCRSTERLTIIMDDRRNPEESATIGRAFESYMDDKQGFTLDQIAAGLAELGAETSVARTGLESCPCRLMSEGRLGQGANEETWELFL